MDNAVADQIIKWILAQNLQEGDRLPNEYDLAKQLGVGRSTVREAVRQLSSRNVLRVVQGSGTYVAGRTGIPDDPLGFIFIEDKQKLAFDLIEIRMILEPSVAALAAQRASEEECRRLRDIVAETNELRSRGLDYRDTDMELHCTIAKLSHNSISETLLPIIKRSVAQTETFVDGEMASLTHEQRANIVNARHNYIVDAICRGDAEGARCAMVAHLMLTYNFLREQLEERNKKGCCSN
ncbi:MAG: FadR family transcriptional regulator [Oscillibacter sp.]|nr:FadR family transcriptional regulator [Oscillibacter sp.]